MKPLLIIALFFFTLLFISCAPNGPVETQSNYPFLFQSEKSPFRFYGTVTDVNNNPVSLADVHFLFKMNQQLNKATSTTNPMPSTNIRFSIPTTGHTSLKVFRLGTRQLIETLIDTIMQSGSHEVAFNVNAYTNGFYVYELKSENFYQQKLMALFNNEVNLLLETKPLIITDYQGKFSLPLGVFALEETFVQTDEAGNVIGNFVVSDSIGFVLYKGTSEPTIEWTRINRYSNTEKTFVMK